MSDFVKWQSEKKYVRFIKPFPHYQVAKFNGTKGYVEMGIDNIGIFDEGSCMYVFKAIKGVVPQFLEKLIIGIEGKLTAFYNSIHTSKVYDEDHKKNIERFDIRLIKATSSIDVDTAWMFFCAAEADRLSIKQTIMSWEKISNQ